MNKKPFYFCMQKAEGNVHQIFIYDDIEKHGDFNWQTWSYDESETSAAHFRDVLNTIPSDAEIEIHFNTNGGSVSEGTSIYNLRTVFYLKKNTSSRDCSPGSPTFSFLFYKLTLVQETELEEMLRNKNQWSQ